MAQTRTKNMYVQWIGFQLSLSYEGNVRNLNGNNIISSVESPDNPNFTDRVLARYKESTIVKIDKNVHIHDSGVKR